MPDAQVTEYERLNRALSIYRDAMRRHIKEMLEDEPPVDDASNDWFERKVIAKLESSQQQLEARRTRDRYAAHTAEWEGQNQLDIPHFLFVIKHNGGFRKLRSQEMFDLMSEIYDARNRWAHPPLSGFKQSEVDRTIHQIVTILNQFDQGAAAQAAALRLHEMEFTAGLEAVDAITRINEAVQALLDKPEIDPNAISDVIRSSTDAPRLVREISDRIDHLEDRLGQEQKARERQLSQISETLGILVQAERERREAESAADPRPDWIEALLGTEAKQWLNQLRRALNL